MPLGIAILTFFALEGFLLSYPGTLFGDILFGLIGSGAAYLVINFLENEANMKRDNPCNLLYELPTPQAFSLILSTLKIFRAGERRWVISEINRNHYSITAFSEWHDQSWRKYNRFLFDAPLFRQIKLQLFMRRKTYRLTELAMIWSVRSPLTRSECNAVQSCTSKIIQGVLRRAEIERAEKFKTAI
jgi:hypothetical protein